MSEDIPIIYFLDSNSTRIESYRKFFVEKKLEAKITSFNSLKDLTSAIESPPLPSMILIDQQSISNTPLKTVISSIRNRVGYKDMPLGLIVKIHQALDVAEGMKRGVNVYISQSDVELDDFNHLFDRVQFLLRNPELFPSYHL